MLANSLWIAYASPASRGASSDGSGMNGARARCASSSHSPARSRRGTAVLVLFLMQAPVNGVRGAAATGAASPWLHFTHCANPRLGTVLGNGMVNLNPLKYCFHGQHSRPRATFRTLPGVKNKREVCAECFEKI